MVDIHTLSSRIKIDLYDARGAASENSEALVKDICEFLEREKIIDAEMYPLLESYRITLTANGECDKSQNLHDKLCKSLKILQSQ